MVSNAASSQPQPETVGLRVHTVRSRALLAMAPLPGALERAGCAGRGLQDATRCLLPAPAPAQDPRVQRLRTPCFMHIDQNSVYRTAVAAFVSCPSEFGV
eukprot:scaffold2807_cov60-Phaeocystis_antarctica.AAC.2